MFQVQHYYCWQRDTDTFPKNIWFSSPYHLARMPHQDPPPISTLIFSSAASNFSHTLTQLRRRNLSIENHLRSIDADAQFIEAVSTAYNRPLVANERCGSWYIPPNRKHSSCYFKSTDGHVGQWSFSLRRLNLHLLKIVQDGDGYGCVSYARLRDMLS